jgi:ricin-type beta-trefoil lectin protein/F5/8 type C domain-containing protein/cellulase (glycosyl hydrolase family 5)
MARIRSPHPSTSTPAARRRHRVVAWTAAILTTLATACLMVVSNQSTAEAAVGLDPSQFHGVHWSRLGDNFSPDRLVLQGLSPNDDYNTTRGKADAMFASFQSGLGANTVRLPINPATTAWASYNGVIDAATARGFKVILCYWAQDGSNMVPSSLLNTWNQMWDTLAARYLSNPLVYFDPINEPIGFNTAQWLNFAATWIARMNAAGLPNNRMFIEGAQLDGGGWGSDIRPLCNDARFNGVYLALHRYAFPYGSRTYDQWVTDLTTLIGNCADRTVIEEFGASADTGVDFNATPSGSTDKEVAYLRALTDVVHNLHLGAIWCHTIGGRTSTPDHDTLNNLRLGTAFDGSLGNTPLWQPDTTANDRLQYAWGGPTPGPTGLRNVGSNTCLDVPNSSQANDVQLQVAGCVGATNQRFTRQANGSITVYNGTKCLDAFGSGKTNNTRVVIHDCLGGNNQNWRLFSDGTIRGADSRLCLDADPSNAQNVRLWSCGSGTNQKWTLDVNGTTPPPPGNLALNRPASASSSCNANEGPAKAVNGTVNGGNADKWCALDAAKWWQVDLGSSMSVSRFVVRHAGAGGENTAWNTRDYDIQVSTNGTTWTTVSQVRGNTANVSTHTIAAAQARYARINVLVPTSNTDTAARIYEFEVYAS